MRWAIGCDFIYTSTSKVSPNDTGIVIIIIVDEAGLVFHGGGIIAQSRFQQASGWKMLLKQDQAETGKEAQ